MLSIYKDLADVLLQGDLYSFLRAGVIVVSLTMTTVEYFKGMLSW